MPAKNVIKKYVSGGYYHLYNRGAGSQIIYHDEFDYEFFLSTLKRYLAMETKTNPRTGLRNPMNLFEEVRLHGFCLMTNHFHLLVEQKTTDGIIKLTRRVLSTYAGYYHNRYGTEGSLFSGKLRGVLVDSDRYLLQLSRYIHRNPSVILQPHESLATYGYSSYMYYLDILHASWVHTETILDISLKVIIRME